MRKIAWGHEAWMQAEDAHSEPAIWELVEQFQECPDTSTDSDVFMELCERICESNTIYPAFYLVFPYMVDIVTREPEEAARELWMWMGAWLSDSYQSYASKMSEVVMEVYRESLIVAEVAVLDFISRHDFSSYVDFHYLLGAPFAFVRPKFGYLSTVLDTEFEEEASCPGGHIESYNIRRKGITDSSDRYVSVREISWKEIRVLLEKMPVRHPNPWDVLLPVIDAFENCEEKQIAEAVCKKGISRETPFRIAVFLYIYLLQNISRNKEEILFSKNCRRMFDKISCPVCGVHFTFIDGWQNLIDEGI